MTKRKLISFLTLAMVTVGWVIAPASFAQSVPSSCDGVNYDCTAILVSPYDYTHNTCGTHEYRGTEAESFQDELNEWSSPSICNLTTERIGWYTVSTPIGYCGVQSNDPSYGWGGWEIGNTSKYMFRYYVCGNPALHEDVNNAVIRHRETYCYDNYALYDGGTSGIARCRRQSIRTEADKQLGKPDCEKNKTCGNPINTAISNKYQEETDYEAEGIGGLVLKRYYNSGMDWGNYRTAYATSGQWAGNSYLGYNKYVKLAFLDDANQHKLIALDSIGAQWRHYYQRAIYLNVAPTFVTAMVYRHDGRVVPFNLNNGSYVTEGDINDKLIVLADGRFQFTDARDETVETYLPSGYLESIRHRNGMLHTIGYDSCMRIASATDQFGHSLQFNYEHTCSDPNKVYRIESITLPGGGVIDYGYNTSNGTLTSVTYPDSTVRGYSYGWDNGRRLTGITDESGIAFASWTYNSTGRPITSQHAGGAGAVSIVSSGGVGAPTPGTVTITDSLGAITTHRYTVKRGLNLISSVERPHPSGTGIMDEVWTYDANGNVATYSNNRNYRTNYVFDLTRNLETSRTEGLNNSGTTTPETRTITTQWHATLRLPTLITELGRTTGFTYDANGNALTRTITDTATSVSRVWTWTFDSYGRMLTADGPRTDTSDVTTYTYYTCATGNQCGQVQTITNAMGHITTYLTYNAHGQPLTIQDPNNVLTTLTYDGRQRLTSRSIAGETTSYAYWPTGLLKRVTMPDSSYTEYTYDNAHRLVQLSDSEANHIVYTLDAMGNRTAENTYDPFGALSKTMSRVYNNLNRLFQELGAQSQTTQFTYDNNGNLLNATDPLLRVTGHTYDPLDRLKTIINPLLGQTIYAYNARDELTSVTDPRGLVTQQSRNGFGEVTQLTSPDTGITTKTYDSSGSVKTSTDARSKTSTYTYDAIGRVTNLTVGSDQPIVYTYDSGIGQVGRLSQLQNAGATVTWTYDSYGRVLSKTQVANSITRAIGYQYNTAGQLTQITTPSNKNVVYGYANGRISSITVNGTILLNNVIYEPLRSIGGWTWGNGTLAVRTYDLDGRTSQIDSAGLRTYGYDNVSRITSILDAQNSALDQTYGYDNLSHLTAVTKANGNQSFTYDANGNRLTYTDGVASSTYTISPTSNRLESIAGSQARTYAYNSVGAVTGYSAVTLAYSDRERLKSATVNGSTWDYYINGFGERVRKKLSPSGNNFYVHDEAGHLIGEYNGNTLIQETVWLGDIPVATLRGSNIFYVHTDHANAPRKVTQPSNNGVRWSWDRDAFGNTAPNENPGGLGVFAYNLRLPGQFFDIETGLNYNYYRDYDPAIGRYIESDPIGLGGGINTYSYARANPVNLTDPRGLDTAGCDGVPDRMENPCRLECCAVHDECYDRNECSANSWYCADALQACRDCNSAAKRCFAACVAGSDWDHPQRPNYYCARQHRFISIPGDFPDYGSARVGCDSETQNTGNQMGGS